MSTAPPIRPGLPAEALILANGSVPPISFEQRVAAAADAGFDAIGLSVSEYNRLRGDGYDDTGLRDVLDRHSMHLAELEVVLGFAATGEDLMHEPIPGIQYTDRATEARMLHMATTFGARHLQAVGTFHSDVLEDRAVEAFADLCDRAAEHNLLIALEFVPGTNVPDAGVATALVLAADRPNGGLCVDSWHHFRGRNDEQLLDAIPPERVFMIQLDDGAAKPIDDDFLTDTLSHRLPPGEGAFDLTRFLTTLWAQGARAPISVEVLSTELARRPALDVAHLLAAAARRVLAGARE